MDDPREAIARAERAAQVNADVRPVHISDEVVSRPASPATATVHSFLRHLRAKGLTCVPDPIDVVDGVERLTYIEGASGGDAWHHQHDDSGLASAARLLRSVHDAGRDWTPPGDAVWGSPAVGGPDRVYCHGDPGPWNFVWRDQEAVALLDWDFLHPAPSLDDVAYALQWFTPLRSDEFALEWHHFPGVPDRRHRIRVLLDAYGELPQFSVADAVSARMQATSDLVRSLAGQGVEPQRSWVQEGALEQQAAEIAWIRDNVSVFT